MGIVARRERKGFSLRGKADFEDSIVEGFHTWEVESLSLNFAPLGQQICQVMEKVFKLGKCLEELL